MRRVAVVAFAAALACGCLGITACASSEVKAVTDKIDAVCSSEEVTMDDISEVNALYDALSEEDKGQVDNYADFQEICEGYAEHWYKQLKEKIEDAEHLAGSYFAQYFDTKDFKAALKSAKAALEDSAEDAYESTCRELATEYGKLYDFVEEEMDKSYSAQTTTGKYPFAVDKDDIPLVENWSYQPIIMQSSKQPDWLSGNKKTTDRPANVTIFIDGGGYWYTVHTKQVPTKKISVQDSNGDIQTAYVNTQVTFKHIYDGDKNISKNEQPAYFLLSQDDTIQLALHSYDGKKHYVLYEQ